MEREKQVVTADDVGTVNAAALAGPGPGPAIDPAVLAAAQQKVDALDQELQALNAAHRESKDRVNAKKDELAAARQELKKLQRGH
jgi:hypothetical protein